MIRLFVVLVSSILMSAAIDVKFHDMFGGLQKISIPKCKAEPCNIIQGKPLTTHVTFVPKSPYYNQGKTFKIFTTGYLSTTIENGYGNMFGAGLTGDSDLTHYDRSFPLTPNEVSTAIIPLVAPRIDPEAGPFKSTGNKTVRYLINVGNSTDFITVVSATITLNVIH